ncbi:MAG TPA: hypothetical protein PLY58_01045 [Bacilli bacterium]|jgi:hypothetical protein|nr:hypothetical protein [Bacilli bacterium]HPY79694.1 hypothetical protein [Bacilli bacterium]HQA55666.1 hypothetical protein [Bacilli bacterium]
MKKLFKEYKWLVIVLGIVIFSLGLITLIMSLVWRDETFLLKVICIIVACYCYAIAIFNLLFTLIAERKAEYDGISGNLLTSGALIGFGVTFSFFADNISNMVISLVKFCLPWLLISLAAVVFIKFLLIVVNKESKHKYAAWVRALVVWVLLLTAGIIFWVVKDELAYFVYASIGVLIMIIGLLVLSLGIVAVAKDKRADNVPVVKEKKKKRKEKGELVVRD